jgi:ribosomal protein S18 acetylase RimI-like enzyme
MLVAEVDGDVCGVLSIRWHGGCDAPHPWLYGGAVLPALRRRGVGTALWLEAHQLCVARGASHASLDIDVVNVNARRLYERLGYVVLGPHEHSWVARDESGEITGRGSADTWLMRCNLLP